MQCIFIVHSFIVLTDNFQKDHYKLNSEKFYYINSVYILTGQLFGIFPLSGVFDKDPNRIRLVWPTVRVALDLIVLGAGIANTIAECMRLRMVGVNAKNINGLIFFVDGCIINVLFLLMATKWNRVAVKWDSVDRIFLTESYRIESKWTLKRRLWTATALLLGLACCEHLLATINNLNDQWHEIEHCGWKENITDTFRHFSLRKFSNMYSIVPYSTVSAVFFSYVSFALTLYWNYLDVFIILISIAIATRFDQINTHLRTLAGGGVLIPNEPFWIRVRTHYVSLCELLDEVDQAVAWIVLISCATNLYFICLQILNVSQKLRYPMNDVYYWFSLLFLMGRTATLFLCAAHIHEAAKRPLDIVAKIPNNGWSVELDRFSSQLKSETVALSGMGFFHITRQLLFSMAGTIVTYELVMLKFDKESEGKGYIRPCSFFDIEKKWLT
ncbi:AAEL000060-PA, partial [Aedes aegypti]